MDTARNDQLFSLMEKAYKTCIDLDNYTRNNLHVFQGDNDDLILELIQKRENYIRDLTDIEYEIDCIFEEVDDYKNGDNLPSEIAEMRSSIRTILNRVSAMDLEAMEFISGKMQEYKMQTMKARSKKHLSAYFRSGASAEPGNNVDCKK